MMHCWHNRFGDWKVMRCAFFIECLGAKYFPHNSVLDCEISNKGSYTWKSIIQEKHVIDLGSVWRIGNGHSVNIRGDRWISHIAAPKIISPASGLPLESKVCDLINGKNHQWNSALIDQEFLPHEASLIKGIPLSIQEILDSKVWIASAHGEYTT